METVFVITHTVMALCAVIVYSCRPVKDDAAAQRKLRVKLRYSRPGKRETSCPDKKKEIDLVWTSVN